MQKRGEAAIAMKGKRGSLGSDLVSVSDFFFFFLNDKDGGLGGAGMHCGSCSLTGTSCSAVSRGQGSKALYKSGFQLSLPHSQTCTSHSSSTFSSPPTLRETARIHTYTQLETLQARWTGKGRGRGHPWLSVSMMQHDFHYFSTDISGFHSHATAKTR